MSGWVACLLVEDAGHCRYPEVELKMEQELAKSL